METTISLAKEHGLAALTLLAVLYFQNDLGGDIQTLRTEMEAGHQAIRAEMAEDHQAIRAEMAEDHQAIRADISALGERVARVETRTGGIEERLERDLPPDD